MKRKTLTNIFIIAALVAFLAVCLGFGIGMKYPEASAEEPADTSQDVGSEDLSGADESAQDSATDSVTEPPASDIEEEPEEPAPDYDLDDFLAWVQGYADAAGLGNEFANAVEAIKTAASERQVTISTVFSVGVLLAVIVLLIKEHLSKKNLTKLLAEVSEQLKAQTEGTNGLIDESNANGKAVSQTKDKADRTADALGHIVKGLSTLASRTNIGAAYKEQIQTEFNAAEKSLGGAADESNKTL